MFWCTNPATGAATWAEVGGAGDGVSSVFGRTGAVVAADGDYTADQIDDGGGKVLMTDAERTTLAAISFPAKVIPLAGTGSDEDNANIRAAIAAIKASGQPGEIRMSGDFMIGHAGDLTGIDPDDCADLKLVGRGYCRWYKGVEATTTGLTGGTDPGDNTAFPLLARATDDGPGKRLVIRDIIFEGDLATTQKWLGDASRLIALANYDRVELVDVEGRWGSRDRLSPVLLRPGARQPRQPQPHRRERPGRLQLRRRRGDRQRLRVDRGRLLRRPAGRGRRRRPRAAARLPVRRQPRLSVRRRQAARRPAHHRRRQQLPGAGQLRGVHRRRLAARGRGSARTS